MAAERSPKPKALLEYQVFAHAHLTASGGFLTLSPPTGFADASSGPHFFQYRCLFCGEGSRKDLAVYALDPAAEGCTEKFPPRLLIKGCYPTCPNPAHVVMKCVNPDCRQLGSIEVQEVTGSLTQTACVHLLNIKCQGYAIENYEAGQEWTAVSASGEAVAVFFDAAEEEFNGVDSAGNRVKIPTKFEVLQKE